MPLQKHPPKSHLITDKKFSTETQTLKQRRRTLQTISELVPQHAGPQGPDESLPRDGNGAPNFGGAGNVSGGSGKMSRRRHDHMNIPSASVNPTTTLTLHRSLTDLRDLKVSARSKARRRSMPSTFDARGRSLSPVAEGELPRHEIPDNLRVQGLRQVRPRRNVSDSGVRGKEQQGGWKAREEELIKRDQAFFEANTRRENERHALTIRSSSTLPSFTSAPPTITGSTRTARTQQTYCYSQHVLDKGPTITDVYRRDSRGRSRRQMIESVMDGRLFQDFTGNKSSATAEHSGLRRSHSTIPDSQWFSDNQMTRNMHSPLSSSFISTTPTERRLADPRSSASLRASSTSTRSSSTKSSVSGNSSATRPSQRSSFTYPRASDHPLRQNPIIGPQTSYPMLTKVNSEPNGARATNAQAFVQPQSASHATYTRGPRTTQGESHHMALRKPSCAASRSQARSSTVHISEIIDASRVIYGENPEKRGMGVTRKHDRSLTREDAKELEKRSAREKVKERVRKANELEEERERERVSVKEEEKRRKKKHGFLCGLFASGR